MESEINSRYPTQVIEPNTSACNQGRRSTGAKGEAPLLPSKSGGKGGKSGLLMLLTDLIFHIYFFHSFFPQSGSISFYPASLVTRNSQNLQIPKHRTERYKKSFHYSSLKEWNNTLRDIRESPTINTFKRQLKIAYEEQDISKHNRLEEQLHAK